MARVLFVVIAATALKHQNGVVVRTAPELFVTPVVYIMQNCLDERANLWHQAISAPGEKT
ncbi:hypothetical protein N7530_008710 [Penicillium desertorum]|uniref:Uncharacterized protein n=1 Tax=Penicillium desertorum TaxID=1303715 RepID=A0A9X0BLF5_9EURO|nr:hypothetical protein N7530_008710 [Penicillium desertorum]